MAQECSSNQQNAYIASQTNPKSRVWKDLWRVVNIIVVFCPAPHGSRRRLRYRRSFMRLPKGGRLPALPNYTPNYHLIETVRPLIGVHWGGAGYRNPQHPPPRIRCSARCGLGGSLVAPSKPPRCQPQDKDWQSQGILDMGPESRTPIGAPYIAHIYLRNTGEAKASFEEYIWTTWPAPPNHPLRYPTYHIIETIWPLIAAHWGV